MYGDIAARSFYSYWLTFAYVHIDFVLSSLLANSDRLDEAVNLCGRGLLLRVKLLGVHEKTAESHFHLGLLYFRKELYPEALKELVLGQSL
jgi:hypothetical protein